MTKMEVELSSPLLNQQNADVPQSSVADVKAEIYQQQHHHHHGPACQHGHHNNHAHNHDHDQASMIWQSEFAIPSTPYDRKCALVTLLRSGSYSDFEKLVAYMVDEVMEEDALHELDQDGATLVHWAAKREDTIKFLELLHEKGLNLHLPTQNKLKMYPIHWAASEGLIFIVAWFIRHQLNDPGVNPLQARDASGCTPLLVAAQNGHVDMVAYMIQKGADPGAIDDSKDSALHWGAYKGTSSIVGLLLHLDSSASFLDIPDAFGQTPLHLASVRGNTEVVQYLLYDAGSKAFSIPDKKGRTPLDLAIRKGHNSCIMILEEHEKERMANFSLRGRANKWFKELCSLSDWKVWVQGGAMGDVGGQNNRVPFLLVVFTMIVGESVYPMRFFSSENYALLADLGGLHMFAFVCNVLMWVFFYLTNTTNPGVLENRNKKTTFAYGSKNQRKFRYSSTTSGLSDFTARLEERYIEAIENMGNFGDEDVAKNPMHGKKYVDPPQLCHSCHIVKPPRSKHCRVNRKCVLVFDHYCPFVSNAIGMYNHLYFVLYLFFVDLSVVCVVYTTFIFSRRIPDFDWYTCIVSMYITVFGVCVAVLFLSHIAALGTNLTTNEQINLRRYEYFWDSQGRFRNPWNRGFCTNIYDRIFPNNALFILPDNFDALQAGCCASSNHNSCGDGNRNTMNDMEVLDDIV
mmetsp:Transcript_12828/g.19448  ORF Transcript_12828/g.19448 Transcript_12828/m.19448 type:complete len:687 (+) Transcript_12828:88-2148(+)